MRGVFLLCRRSIYGRARLLPSRDSRTSRLGGSLALPESVRARLRDIFASAKTVILSVLAKDLASTAMPDPSRSTAQDDSRCLGIVLVHLVLLALFGVGCDQGSTQRTHSTITKLVVSGD